NCSAALRIYSAIPRCDNGEEWLNIGLAVPHQDGKGFDVILHALPLNSRLILRDSTEAQHQPPNPMEPDGDSDVRKPPSLKQQADAFERTVIEQCLLDARGKISTVMERLDLPRRTLNEKMARLGIDRHRLVRGAKAEAGGKAPAPNIATPDNDRHPQSTANPRSRKHEAFAPSIAPRLGCHG